MEDLVRRVGLRECEGFSALDHALAQLGTEGFLISGGRSRAFQVLATARCIHWRAGGHFITPASTSPVSRSRDNPATSQTISSLCSPMPGAR